jgi:hypothetical protein
MPTGAVTTAETRLGVTFPPAIKALYADSDGRWRQDGQWWVVWPLDRVIADNDVAWREDRLPRDLLAFGDDGTGNPFCVRLSDDGDRVLRWSWIDADVETDEGDMDRFLSEWLAD